MNEDGNIPVGEAEGRLLITDAPGCYRQVAGLFSGGIIEYLGIL